MPSALEDTRMSITSLTALLASLSNRGNAACVRDLASEDDNRTCPEVASPNSAREKTHDRIMSKTSTRRKS